MVRKNLFEFAKVKTLFSRNIGDFQDMTLSKDKRGVRKRFATSKDLS